MARKISETSKNEKLKKFKKIFKKHISNKKKWNKHSKAYKKHVFSNFVWEHRNKKNHLKVRKYRWKSYFKHFVLKSIPKNNDQESLNEMKDYVRFRKHQLKGDK